VEQGIGCPWRHAECFLGPDSLASLRKLAESYQTMQKKEGEKKEEEDDDDDDIPELVGNSTFDSKVE
jgi:nascent polypeptide-associated complex subunit beta